MSDNILVAFETLHHFQRCKTRRSGFVTLKLNVSRAYNHVEQNFLAQLMVKTSFHEKLVGLIMECISSVSYSILINGEPKGTIKPTRGIRKGDPLSPYLFLLCSEGSNGLIQKAVNDD